MNKVLHRFSIIILLSFLLSACQNGKKDDQHEDDDDLLTQHEMREEEDEDDDDDGQDASSAEFARAQAAFDKGDYRTAIQYLLPLAQAGNPDAQYALGYLLYEGLGTQQDRMQAYFWIQEAARQGNTTALLALEIFEIDPDLPLDH